jgi:hypothetical protein
MSPRTSGTGRGPPVRQRLQAVHLLLQFGHLMTQAVALFAFCDWQRRRVCGTSSQYSEAPVLTGVPCMHRTQPSCVSTSRQYQQSSLSPLTWPRLVHVCPPHTAAGAHCS